MRITGFFDERFEPPAPFIRTVLKSKNLELSHRLHLHIDTGASVTIIFDKDIELLGINPEKLKKAERNVGGIGGMVNTYVIEDATLLFRTEDRKIHEEKLRLFVGKHDPTKLSPSEIEIIMRMPSLLGRDIIHRFKLVCDKSRDEIYLESTTPP